MNQNDLQNMSEEELILNIDAFLTYLGMDVSDITMKQRKKMLVEAINKCKYDNAYVEYRLASEIPLDEAQELQNRMDATNILMREIRMYYAQLPPTSIFEKIRRRKS